MFSHSQLAYKIQATNLTTYCLLNEARANDNNTYVTTTPLIKDIGYTHGKIFSNIRKFTLFRKKQSFLTY